ncbi:Dinitrogenase iron-molybdenum cofactor biosynthesis protein [Desulfofarcimen acetoxidans DSM 771]|uniref:Dinitrogenase iron-molybdenum cofactor biosynthesis protein n=1 Tax=Desulfofarcimen acetoxidans (strain ATCC 49208 / DSM 771 / KCTC 5769 / VKM B-1644 / 5575) TaxID=485916 RepID=C8W4W4_DESAS|nr:NifB/NifX family molybdenum-iron cluster-binding protein [Desulfofarcimen acetoxidans]ACV61316.1 Dinitrogenase iron-molybdenum cofactor biosynthesis protein [Desulfofarcimen acetoxidans DSM 771]
MEGKVAISAFGNDAEAMYSPHFGAASHFVIYNLSTGETEVVENVAHNLSAGRGEMAARLLLEHGIKAVVTQLIGPRPFRTFQENGVNIYPGLRLMVEDITRAVQEERLSPPLSGPTEESHSGGECNSKNCSKCSEAASTSAQITENIKEEVKESEQG